MSHKVSEIIDPDEVETYVSMPSCLFMCDKEVIEA